MSTEHTQPNGKPHKCGFPPCKAPAPANSPMCGRHMEEMEFVMHVLSHNAVGGYVIMHLLGALAISIDKGRQWQEEQKRGINLTPQAPPKLFGPEGGKLR